MGEEYATMGNDGRSQRGERKHRMRLRRTTALHTTLLLRVPCRAFQFGGSCGEVTKKAELRRRRMRRNATDGHRSQASGDGTKACKPVSLYPSSTRERRGGKGELSKNYWLKVSTACPPCRGCNRKVRQAVLYARTKFRTDPRLYAGTLLHVSFLPSP